MHPQDAFREERTPELLAEGFSEDDAWDQVSLEWNEKLDAAAITVRELFMEDMKFFPNSTSEFRKEHVQELYAEAHRLFPSLIPTYEDASPLEAPYPENIVALLASYGDEPYYRWLAMEIGLERARAVMEAQYACNATDTDEQFKFPTVVEETQAAPIKQPEQTTPIIEEQLPLIAHRPEDLLHPALRNLLPLI